LTSSQRKFNRSLVGITKGVAGYLGDGCRDANLLLSIKAQGRGDGTRPVPAKHHILFSAQGHQQQSRTSLRSLRVHNE
jgi:hypothetical protein